jgi:hypothetical protein
VLTKALKIHRAGDTRLWIACLNSLPDTPAANIFDFFVGKIFDFVPFEYGNADSFAQMIYVKYFAEIDIAGVMAACNGVRGGEWADDGYTLGQQSEVNDVPLGMLSLSERATQGKKLTYVMTSLAFM